MSRISYPHVTGLILLALVLAPTTAQRFSGTTGNRDYQPGADLLEIPSIAVRGGVTVLW